MSGSVTVPGNNAGVPVTVAPGTGDVLQLATQISALLETIAGAGKLRVNTGTLGSLPAAPFTFNGTVAELLITGNAAGSATIPTGYSYAVDINTVPNTVSGANLALITGTAGGSFNVSGISTVAATAGDNLITASDLYVVATGTGNDTISATGIGTVAGGAGANLISTSGVSNIYSNGQDTVVLGSGLATVNSAGSNSLIFGSGTEAGLLNVVDNGANDTVIAMNSPTTVTAGAGSTGLFAFGGTSPFTFVGGPNAATVLSGTSANYLAGGTGGLLVGAIGNVEVSGQAPGGATIFGTSDSNVSYSGNGDLLYAAGSGNESLNAAGSTGTNALFAVGPANASMMGGAGTNLYDAGAGSDTFTGGSGSNTYFFIAGNTAGSHDFITNLANTDAVGLLGFDPAGSSISVANGSATLTLSDNTEITFVNVTDITNNIHYG